MANTRLGTNANGGVDAGALERLYDAHVTRLATLETTGSGQPGAKGDKGDPGTKGLDSTVPGPKGEKGDSGADSTVPGPKGDNGAPGAKGDKGDKGDTGAASTMPGPKGDMGATGLKGDAGAASTVPGPQGPAGAASVGMLMIRQAPYATWGIPAAITFLFAQTAYCYRVALGGFTQARMSVARGSTAFPAGTKLGVYYSAAWNATASAWTATGTEVSPLTANVPAVSAWVDLPVGARGDVYLTVMGYGGNTTAAQIGGILVEFR
jgi:hypothetical protein